MILDHKSRAAELLSTSFKQDLHHLKITFHSGQKQRAGAIVCAHGVFVGSAQKQVLHHT